MNQGLRGPPAVRAMAAEPQRPHPYSASPQQSQPPPRCRASAMKRHSASTRVTSAAAHLARLPPVGSRNRPQPLGSGWLAEYEHSTVTADSGGLPLSAAQAIDESTRAAAAVNQFHADAAVKYDDYTVRLIKPVINAVRDTGPHISVHSQAVLMGIATSHQSLRSMVADQIRPHCTRGAGQ
jgi:hypothetical protein